jgi:hypothetical protein
MRHLSKMLELPRLALSPISSFSSLRCQSYTDPSKIPLMNMLSHIYVN